MAKRDIELLKLDKASGVDVQRILEEYQIIIAEQLMLPECLLSSFPNRYYHSGYEVCNRLPDWFHPPPVQPPREYEWNMDDLTSHEKKPIADAFKESITGKSVKKGNPTKAYDEAMKGI